MKFLYFLGFFAICLTSQAIDEKLTGEKKEELEPVNELISRLIKPEQEAVDLQVEKVNKLLSRIQKWEMVVSSNEGNGLVDQMRARAEKFAVERQTRKELEAEVRSLLKTINSLKTKHKEALLEAKLAEQRYEMELKKNGSDNKKETDLVKTDVDKLPGVNAFEYDTQKSWIHQVIEPGTLKEISGRPLVYNDESLWKTLYEANKKIIKDPSAVIPKGVVLTVPYVKFTTEFKEE